MSRKGKPSVLVLTHRVPYPPDRGDRLRAWRFIRLLAQVATVDVACFSEHPRLDHRSLGPLFETCRRVEIVHLGAVRWLSGAWNLVRGRTVTEGVFASHKFSQVLRHWTTQSSYDAVLAYCSSTFRYAEPLARQQIPVVVDLVDVDSQKWAQLAQVHYGWRRWLYQYEARCLEHLERYILRHYPVSVVSEREAAILRKWDPVARIQVIPNGVDLEYFRPASSPQAGSEKPCCVFVGVLDYVPNVDAVMWFVKNVWPGVRTHYPDARLLLVGKRPTAGIRRLNRCHGIELYADVPDVRPYVWQAHVSIAPLRIARGVQNKVLEAMAMGRAVIASTAALQGIDLGQPPAIKAETADEWVEGLLRVWKDPFYRRELEIAGRHYVERYHDHRQCMNPMVSLLLGDTQPANPMTLVQ